MDTTVNRNVVDYSLIESDSHAELVEAIANACSTAGWFPQGGICIWVEPSDKFGSAIVHYAQALVKYEPLIETLPVVQDDPR